MIPDWQMNVLNTLHGIKPSQLILTMAGRGSGKSQLTNQAFMRLWDDIHHRPVEDLKLTEGTVYGSRYYCVEPTGGSWRDMEHWCHTTFGNPGDKIWNSETKSTTLVPAPLPEKRWYMNNRKFWFRDQADQLMFVMKWR
jgi:hypothetical protein